jgi:hypothetical protein
MRPYILILFAVVVLIGCGKDKEDPQPVSKLVGTWNTVSTTTELTVGDKTYKQYLIEDLSLSEEEADAFNDLVEQLFTLTGFLSDFTVNADGTYTGHTDLLGQSIDAAGKWTLSDDEKSLTLTNDADPGAEQHGTITKLTDTDLWLEVAGDEIDNPEGTPSDPELVGKVIVKLTRQK